MHQNMPEKLMANFDLLNTDISLGIRPTHTKSSICKDPFLAREVSQIFYSGPIVFILEQTNFVTFANFCSSLESQLFYIR